MKLPPLPGQLDLVAHIAAKFGKRPANPRQFNAIVAAANSILAEMGVDHIPAPPGCGAEKWLDSDECGLSSIWLHRFLSGLTTQKVEHPHDAADFRRCVVMLAAIPESRAALTKVLADPEAVKAAPAPWNTLLPEWETLEKLLQEESPTLTDTIRKLTEH